MSDSINEIRALTRGLRLLELVNLHSGGRLRDFVSLSGLPKTTCHRILENLRAAGYLRRDDHDDRYHVTLQARRLSDGYYEGGWISEVARPVLDALAQRVRFPVAIATPYGAGMMLRDNTDAQSTLAPNVFARGTVLPLLTSATGKVYLAFCDDVTRKTLLDVCAASPAPEDHLAHSPELVRKALTRVRQQGYAFGRGARIARAEVPTATIAVPIRAQRRLIGCLAMRYLTASLSREAVIERYYDILRRHAWRIGQRVRVQA